MPSTLPVKKRSTVGEGSTRLFIKRVLNNPRQLGAVIPSSTHLGNLIAKNVNSIGDSPILELGGGTGALTKSMIAKGIAPERIYIIELDSELCEFLRAKFPQCHVIQGCATQLGTLLPKNVVGEVFTTVSGLPLLNMPKDVREKIMQSTFGVMAKDGYLLQYTYSPKASPLAEDCGLKKEKLGTILRNVPPATVWKYSR